MELNRKTLNEQLYDALKQEILSHQIGFGEKLSNRELQSKFSVSSTPVRDAINHLYMDGLIEDISKVGARVISFDLQFALEINEVILMLSSTAVRNCIERNAPNELSLELAELLRRQRASTADEEYIALDRQFHELFFLYAGNRQLKAIYDRYIVLQELLVRYFYDHKDNKQDSIETHQMILSAVSKSDLSDALRALELHYSDAADVFHKHIVSMER